MARGSTGAAQGRERADPAQRRTGAAATGAALGPIDKAYRFETDEGTASLADLFKGRSQLLIYHFMFGPDYMAGCPSCSSIADGFNGVAVHLANHDVTLCAVSRAPLAKLQAYKRRMGWSFPWASSSDSDFNFDFQASHTAEQPQSGVGEYNFAPSDLRPSPESGDENAWSGRFSSSPERTGRPICGNCPA